MRWFRSDARCEQSRTAPTTSYLVWSAIAFIGTLAGTGVAFQAMHTVPALEAALQGILVAILWTAAATGLAVVARAAASRIRRP